MELNSVSASIGLVAQLIGFILLSGLFSITRSTSFSLLLSAIFSVFGYSVLTSFGMLLGIPWQVMNVVFAICCFLIFFSPKVRNRIFSGLRELTFALTRELVSVIAFLALLAFHVGVVFLSPELSIDGQLYHGPVLASIVNSGTLWGWTPINQYAYYTDSTMSGGVNLAVFTGNSIFDNGIQVPYLAILVLAFVWVLGKKFRNVFLRISLSILLVSAPVIWLQPRILYVDLAYGVGIVVALLMVVFANLKKFPDLIGLGVSIAFVVSAKPAGLLAGGFIFCIALIRIFFELRPTKISIKAPAVVRALALFAIFLTGLSFYIRNIFLFGNPLYPVTVSLGQIQLPGIIDINVFTTGNRGNGFVDLSRIASFGQNILIGITNGVEKLDYDPRQGGFGYIPLIFVLVIFAYSISLVVMQKWAFSSVRSRQLPIRSLWRKSLELIFIGAGILALQPSTFDSRYVIGIFIVLLIAIVLLVPNLAQPLVLDRVFALIALTLAIAQISWIEVSMYPGLSIIRSLKSLQAEYQPSTPGNIWGNSTNYSWMKSNSNCETISIESEGGIGDTGMKEITYAATLSYALYGPRLCNKVIPLLSRHDPNSGKSDIQYSDQILASSYVLVNQNEESDLRQTLQSLSDCFSIEATISGNETYPENIEVYKNNCL